MEKHRYLPLEALRGIAALVVVLWHCMLGFFPESAGIFDEFPKDRALNGQPWFGLLNGTAAVVLFFVLSGFVLTRRYFLTRDSQIIIFGVVKRWPRLAGPVGIAVLVSYLLSLCAAYRFEQGAMLTQSPWLAHAIGTPISFFSALAQGSYWTFFRGDFSYDTSLWSMRYEFVGSFISFGLALFLVQVEDRNKFVALSVFVVFFLLCYLVSPYFSAFIVGVFLALYLPAIEFNFPPMIAILLSLLALYLIGYNGRAAGAYRPVYWFFRPKAVDVQIVASVLWIIIMEYLPDGGRKFFSGRISRFLGLLSFPVYLIHVLVLCSLGCWVLISASPSKSYSYDAAIFSSIITIIFSIIAALPLIYFNEKWVLWINNITKIILTNSKK